MATCVVLLRAVNVGGTGKLAMSALRMLCERCGYQRVRTYIASGNVVLDASVDATRVQGDLQAALHGYAGKPVGVIVRTASEIAAVRDRNPFPACAPERVHVIFLDSAPPDDLLQGASGRAGEEIVAGPREIYVYYPLGQGASKLKLAAARSGTARNMNTVAKLAQLAGV